MTAAGQLKRWTRLAPWFRAIKPAAGFWVALAACCLAPLAGAQTLPGWTLVWADEFDQPDGSQPDPSRWTFDVGGGGWGNNELQTYTTRTNNCRVENGQLIIEARQEAFTGPDGITRPYTSARIKTQGRAAWTFGRIETRVRLPRGNGMWPAFWMLGTNFPTAGWPACGEIDIMEHIGREPTRVHGTIHGPGYSGGNGIGQSFTLPGGGDFANDFHVFAVEWETNRIRWFVDGQQFFVTTPASLPAGRQWVFNHGQFLLLNLAVGGNWPGSPDSSTVFPQRLTVDYVRVYAAQPQTDCDGNVLTNAGFEVNGLANWTRYGPNTYLVTTPEAPVHSGTNALKVFGQFNGQDNYSGVYQDRPCEPGRTYQAGGWGQVPVGDTLAGGNTAWLEVSFRDASSTMLALYRSAPLNASTPTGVWQDLRVTNQFNPSTYTPIGTAQQLVAPAGTATVRFQVVFRQPAGAGGSALFDELWLDYLAPPAPPRIERAAPDGSALFLPAGTELSFDAVSPCAGIATDGIEVTLNGIDISELLEVSGPPPLRTARFSGLTTNQQYHVEARVTDLAGLVTTMAWRFVTYSEDNFTWEAEDFDFSGGLFIDDPMPSSSARTNSYFGRVGVQNVDRRELSFDGERLYRPGDAMATLVAADSLRRRFADAIAAGDTAVRDYKIGYFQSGEWANYTRTYPAGNFRVVGRLAGGAGTGTLHLDRVTGGHGTANQSFARLGSFVFPGRGWQAFDWVTLAGPGTNVTVVELAGRTTLRATTAGGNDPNFFLLTPTRLSVPASARRAGDELEVSFPTFAGVPYRVLASLVLNPPQWQEAWALLGDGRMFQVRLPLNSQRQFLRVIQL